MYLTNRLMDLNRAQLIGNLTQDPELRQTPSGQNVVSFSIATNRTWTDNTGQKQSQAEFHNCVAWGKLAEIISQYCQKGKKVFLEGRLQTRNWEDQSGTKHYRTEIVADNMIMLDRGNAGGMPGSGASAGMNAGVSEVKKNAAPVAAGIEEDEISIEDVPF